MREYRIYKDKYKYFTKICDRDDIDYKVAQNNADDEKNYLVINFTKPIRDSEFQDILDDIKCEMQRERCKNKRPVITLKTFINPSKFKRIMEYEKNNGYTSKSFSFLKGEENKIYNHNKIAQKQEQLCISLYTTR